VRNAADGGMTQDTRHRRDLCRHGRLLSPDGCRAATTRARIPHSKTPAAWTAASLVIIRRTRRRVKQLCRGFVLWSGVGSGPVRSDGDQGASLTTLPPLPPGRLTKSMNHSRHPGHKHQSTTHFAAVFLGDQPCSGEEERHEFEHMVNIEWLGQVDRIGDGE